jgi:hypothetical protein
MATFAKLDQNNIVLDVTRVGNSDTMLNGVEDEATGIAFLTNLTGYSNWKQTSYNTAGNKYYNPDGTLADDQTKAFRGNYAVIGGSWDTTNNIFITAKPFPSWTLNVTTATWESPVSFPNSDGNFTWNENNQQWVEV